VTTHDTTHLRPDDQLEQAASPAPQPPRRPTGIGALTGTARVLWRQLTSMRTALILLFLLALASLPGALLPQWNLDQGRTLEFIRDNPTLGPVLDSAGFFGVFGSPWYAAIYLALFTSLIGCLIPRTWDFVRALRAKPVHTPRNLGRLPHHADALRTPESPEAAAARIAAGLRGWRSIRREEPHGVVTISAEKGFLREVGNLVFHFSLLGLLGAIAVGKMFGFEGTVIVNEGGGFCSSSPSVYNAFRPGLMVDGTQLAPFCVNLQRFDAQYTEAGLATDFDATIEYQAGAEVAAGSSIWTPAHLKVNEPLRLNGERLYLLGHGFSPIFEVTFPNGETRTASQTFQPSDSQLLSSGVVKFLDPPGYTGAEVREHQLALEGIFAPTAGSAHGNANILVSAGAAPNDPAVAIQAWRGDLGMEDGASQSIFALDQRQIDSGALQKLDRANLRPGESFTVDDGTTITFTGYKQWVQLQTSYDPAQGWALVFAITLLGGLMLSLIVKRRRVWYRTIPDPAGGSTVEVGGLARTDQAGYGDEFSALTALARPPRST
jgi:cytochrome c biogenesis protein